MRDYSGDVTGLINARGELIGSYLYDPWGVLLETYQFNDFVIQGQDIGNINFGYTGKALGLPDSVLLAGAGFAQIKAGTSNFSFVMASNGDDLRDQIYIMYGIMLYNEYY